TIAEFYTVFAYTDKKSRHRGISCFVVPRETPGVQPGKHELKMGQHASDTSTVVFEDVRIPAANLLGREGDGFKLLMKTFDKSRPGVGAWAVGLARCAMEYAVGYAGERKQFGLPIGEFQAVHFMLARMARDIDAARLLTHRAAWMTDNGRRNTTEAAMAKSFASDVAMRVTTDAVQVYGGYGYSREYPVEKLMRDAKVLQIYEGTNQIQMMIIGKDLVRS
ncbi:acyl-CoA dehydrogenase family protein, partial [bacterium]|nr:acyl-CoA dehydrogenase family protein [candidate division CSSED10-310 bacterium]